MIKLTIQGLWVTPPNPGFHHVIPKEPLFKPGNVPEYML